MLVSRRRFEELVADALDSIPEALARHVDNVAVLVEDWPTAEQLRAVDGRDPDRGGRGGRGDVTLLGLYEGVALTERGPLAYAGVLPDRITLFRGPLCAVARDEADLAHHVRVTVVHEVAHHFGIDDARLEELGWA